jgi:hypothetical protein
VVVVPTALQAVLPHKKRHTTVHTHVAVRLMVDLLRTSKLPHLDCLAVPVASVVLNYMVTPGSPCTACTGVTTIGSTSSGSTMRGSGTCGGLRLGA